MSTTAYFIGGPEDLVKRVLPEEHPPRIYEVLELDRPSLRDWSSLRNFEDVRARRHRYELVPIFTQHMGRVVVYVWAGCEP